MRAVGLDFGEKRIGIAFADGAAPIAVPRTTLQKNRRIYNVLAKLFVDEGVTDIVLGLPLTMEGEEAYMAKRVRVFGKKLEERTGLPIFYVDERLSSEDALKQGAPDIDAAAAAMILQSWLDSKGSNVQ